MSSERPLANAGPILVVAGIGVVAVVGLVLSLFRDPGLPSYVQDSYMRVAGSLVTPERVEATQRIPQLPAPIIPKVIVGLGKERLAEGPRLAADGESRDPNFRGIGGYGCLHM